MPLVYRAVRGSLFLLVSLLAVRTTYGQGIVIPTDEEQTDFLKAYKFVLTQSTNDYRFTNATMDTVLFPRWGEYSVYWVKSGPRRGAFVYPDILPSTYSSVRAEKYGGYDWRAEDHAAIAFKANEKTIAIFRSGIRKNNASVSWEAVYFKNLLESFLYPGISYYTDEREIDSAGLVWSAQVLVFPAFTVKGTDWTAYIDSVFAAAPRMADNLRAFLARGGTIYTEGNAVYVAEKLGILPPGSVQYAQSLQPDPATGCIELDVAGESHLLGFTVDAAGTSVYAGTIPTVQAENARIIARARGTDVPVVFAITGTAAYNGRLVCNTALPTVGGSRALQGGSSPSLESRQLQWAVNAIMYAFAQSIDVTRSVYNDLPDSLSVGRNAASFDRCDTLEIRVRVRNLSSAPVSGIEIKETIRDFFQFVDVTTQGVSTAFKKPYLTISGISLAPHSETVIVYRIATPDPSDPIHEKVNSYISWANYIYASTAVVSYTDEDGFASYRKYRNYVDMMFSARIVADADLNWKNFLGLYFQPFKVFMIMENKERTSAMNTRYVQYIPKDIPFYWTDRTIDIPILRTPGGKYVDVLRGSNDLAHPEFDMDGDGHPDAWLDTASIFPKNYTIEETEVYWLNPWEHLRSGNKTLYEDIDHDGLRAQDTDGDGVVDIEEPGDKIRVWKVTWNIGTVSGYQFHDPYCSYEIWVDPPDLVPMAAGVARAYGKLDVDVPGMFYPYSPDLGAPNLADTCWMNWMERDAKGGVRWKQLIQQRVNNYEGFTFIDTAAEHYTLKATDRCLGTVPQPHREFIAVLSLGGEEIDMNNPTPEKSPYSNLEYTTIFGEKRNTPIRTTYTYYAPLPNPLQFEYITNNFSITDYNTGDVLRHLPAYGKANLTFEIDASTEYSYYWIRNAGHDVEFNDPSEAVEGVEELGDGVFGYMIYDIPKGMGGYKITLPKRGDGSYDIDKIVSIDGGPYRPWLRNRNTRDSISILEDAFAYHVFIPQILIPPALDDDNFDGVDDWIDDRGDRFQSKTGFLHDAFMLGNGESYPDEPKVPFKDDIYGWVTSGWSAGADGTYGDDFFEKLGRTHVTIRAVYEGSGREGCVDVSKGGWLVVEEIFGGSPWVLFSHDLTAYAEGVNYALTSSVNPTMARYGEDTVYVKHIVEDRGEPHVFDAQFDPFQVSYGNGVTTVTTYSGGKDPCNLISPAVNFPAIIDPRVNHRNGLVLIPNADLANPDLVDYPKTVTGTFLQVRVEVSNGTEWNWINTRITPVIPPELGMTKPVMSYVAYPRPLVPAQVDPATGKVIRGGDDPTAFRAGWRFNQPEGEVLIKLGNQLPLLQAARRAYFVFLFSIDESLPKGVYRIDFSIDGDIRDIDGARKGSVSVAVPSCMFSIAPRDARGNVVEYQKLVVGTGRLNEIRTTMVKPTMTGLERVRWSKTDIAYTDFDTLRNTLPASYNALTGVESIDLSPLGTFPTVGLTRVYLLEQARVSSFSTADKLAVTKGESLVYTSDPAGGGTKTASALNVSTLGPKIILFKTVAEVNGVQVDDTSIVHLVQGGTPDVAVLLEVTNQGASIAEQTTLTVPPGPYFVPDVGRLPAQCTVRDGVTEISFGPLTPGETKRMTLHYNVADAACARLYDSCTVVRGMTATYIGTYSVSGKSRTALFTVPDNDILELPAYDFQLVRLVPSHGEVSPGQTIRLNAKMVNGPVAAANVPVAFYACLNGLDTVLVGTTVVDRLSPRMETIVSADFTIPDTAVCCTFFAKVDPGNRFGEMCEMNNTSDARVSLKGPYWILDVTTHPNPMQNETVISYLLPRDVQDLKIAVVSLDGREIAVIDGAPEDIGRHSVVFRNPALASGTYLLRFEGRNEKGDIQTHVSRIVKVQ